MASAAVKIPRRLCLLGLTDWKCRDTECADTALSALGGLAKRFCGGASAQDMAVTLLRNQ